MKKIYKNVSFLDDDIQMLNIAASISIDKSVSSYLLKNNIPYNIIYSNIWYKKTATLFLAENLSDLSDLQSNFSYSISMFRIQQFNQF